MFKQVRHNRAFEDIILQIQEAILQGKLKDGDRLPNERNLREIFKVSRGTVREALRALEEKRLIKIKTGVTGGTFICPVNTNQVSESLAFLLQYQKISLRELGEFRETTEAVVAAKAAQKAKKEDIQQLTLFLESIKSCLDAGELRWDEIIQEDNKFHMSLARIAGNRVFESVLCTVYDNIYRYFEQFLPRDKKILERVYHDLCKIKDAIENGDSHKAHASAQGHVKRFNRMMEEGANNIDRKYTNVSFQKSLRRG